NQPQRMAIGHRYVIERRRIRLAKSESLEQSTGHHPHQRRIRKGPAIAWCQVGGCEVRKDKEREPCGQYRGGSPWPSGRNRCDSAPPVSPLLSGSHRNPSEDPSLEIPDLGRRTLVRSGGPEASLKLAVGHDKTTSFTRPASKSCRSLPSARCTRTRTL